MTLPRPSLMIGLLACALGSTATLAQYKIVGPDGRVTYTDRLNPADVEAAQPIRIASGGTANDQSGSWPPDLRDASRRYPVVLYTQPRGCVACDSARALLINRGIPFVEKTVTSAADISAFTALTGGERSLPVSTIGKQMLRGLNATDWHAYLDAAGYPKTSKLPSTYRMPQPQSLAGAASPAPSAAGAQDESPSAPARRSRRAPAQEEQPGANPTGIRF